MNVYEPQDSWWVSRLFLTVGIVGLAAEITRGKETENMGLFFVALLFVAIGIWQWPRCN